MESKFWGKRSIFYSPEVSDLKAAGKKSMEWDLNDWKWDGDLFTATPLHSVADCRSGLLFPVEPDIRANNNGALDGGDEMMLGNERGKREWEKRRRVIDVENAEVNDESGSLNLNLGEQVFPIKQGGEDVDKWEVKSGKKSKIAGAVTNGAVCQVEDCRADLSNAKEYHRRHKVCDVHSKATKALVGNVMQRFCQQCSRFHVLQEFDEGKRSCRRRLAGHNKRRRKTHPENAANGASVNDERGSNYLLISLLRILSNIQSSSDQTKDQDLLPHLLRNLASFAGPINERHTSGLPPTSQDMKNAGISVATAEKDPPLAVGQCMKIHASGVRENRMLTNNAQDGVLQKESSVLLPWKGSNSTEANASDSVVGRVKPTTFDLNNVYDDSQDHVENLLDSVAPLCLYTDSHTSIATQNSGNSGSTSTHSPSTSSGEAQSRTDRIVFKLFGKDPSEIPLALRKQILDWLSHSPSDIESYIRPGCIILTIYLRMDKSTWEELYCGLSSSLRRLVDSSTDSFWSTGWIYTRVRHRVAFLYNGQIVLDTLLPLKNRRRCRISSIKPIAVPVSEDVQFFVKGFNLPLSTGRLLCALEGKYLVQESCANVTGEADSLIEHDEMQSLRFPCIIPSSTGRGFIEVEDHGLSSSFFPFIVAEKDVCSEICTLERTIEASEVANGIEGDTDKLDARNEALDFIHEMGWLLHKIHLKFRLGETSANMDLFPFRRFRWLVEFSVDHDWCAVVRRLLGILYSGNVDAGQHKSVLLALMDIGLLHRAVRRNCRSMVELLLRYHQDEFLNKSVSIHKQHDEDTYIFKPDAVGPGGLTPLHIAASLDSCENVLDALTEDPGSVGIEAWKGARDSTGLTPYDYAYFRGHFTYIHLVQRKIKTKEGSGHVVDIPGTLLDGGSIKHNVPSDAGKSAKSAAVFESEKGGGRANETHCRQCEQKLRYGRSPRSSSLAIYRPAMLSMVAIGAVCVCVALLFKSSPEVLYVFQPFRWEQLKYGSS
ncbi:squamosa promoter-binding-like protein 1 [Olea europaea var. sylvestris]|uniref:squamosa promoter-binding-like protein 1 n=1 Tax=Olea europaea var. sylvestris TaxID=158386 RepID=UPI000C1CDDFD|nr:squamosa promoter-binding-like protein 1 [Olea europaea var. sylvestris]